MSRRALFLAGCLGLAYIVLVRVLAGPPPSARREMIEAARLMERAVASVRDCREAQGVPLNPQDDPNATGLIGRETSPTTTSLGRLEAKRTTTNPAFAALVVRLLRKAGVDRGDAVAIGASASFPALIVATLCGVETIGAEALLIVSYGASSWGANIPEFSWGHMEDCLRASGIIDVRPLAVAMGGEEDIGRDMSPEGRASLDSLLRRRGVSVLEEPVLERNVEARLRLYREAASGKALRAFVNIGGSTANIGTSSEVLRLDPGLARRVPIPPPSERGVLQAMAADGVPVIHLLNVRGLCERYGLPWDPRPLPRASEADKLLPRAREGPALLLSALYVFLVVGLLAFGRTRVL